MQGNYQDLNYKPTLIRLSAQWNPHRLNEPPDWARAWGNAGYVSQRFNDAQLRLLSIGRSAANAAALLSTRACFARGILVVAVQKSVFFHQAHPST